MYHKVKSSFQSLVEQKCKKNQKHSEWKRLNNSRRVCCLHVYHILLSKITEFSQMNLFLPYSVWFCDDASSAARSRTETCISLWSLKSSPVRCMDFTTPGWEPGLMGNGVLDQRGDSVGGYVEQWDRSAVLCISLSWCHSEGTQQP